MRLIRGFSQCQPFPKGCVLSIGNFDGLHLGHKAVIKKLLDKGRALGLPVVIMIFEPQPLEFFLGGNAPSRLMRLREKVEGFAKLSVDNLLVVNFKTQVANYEAEQFIEEILVKKLNVKHLVIGDDFRFGKGRCGNFQLLKEQGEIYGFSVEDTGSYLTEGLRVSSTLVRDALRTGDLNLAKRLLGRSYSVSGRVVHGDKRGREIGFPTANINMCRQNCPVSGVFAVTMTGVDGLELQGVANVGTRPTVDGGAKIILETHLFDFHGNLYGRHVEVHFKQKIRAEMRFQTLEQLQAQIVKDVEQAKIIFKSC